MKTQTEERKEVSPARKELIALTAKVKRMMSLGTLPMGTVNEGLVAYYNSQGKTSLKTMTGWNEDGRKLKKGCKALYVWAKPRTNTPSVEGQNNPAPVNQTEEERYRFFPMAKLFCESDTEPMSEKMAEFVGKRIAKYGLKVRKLEL